MARPTTLGEMDGFVFEDLLEGSTEDFSHYFDASEFAVREELESEHYWHVYRRNLILDFVREAVPTDSRLIELGCGTGNVATHLNRHGFHVDFGDVHQEGLDAARRRAERELSPPADDPLRFVRLDISRQFPTGDYDGVLLFDVLEHLPDPDTVLRNTRERLGKGTLIFTVPAFQFLWSPWDDVQKHKCRYTLESARALAERAGFSVRRTTYFFFPLFFAASGVKMLRSIRRAIAPPPERAFDDLMEAKSNPALSAVALSVLEVEKRWLANRNLPCGTSLICVADTD